MLETRSHAKPRWIAAAVMLVVSIPLLASFVQTVRDFETLPDIDGVIIVLGVPIGAFTMTLCSIALVLAAAVIARRGGDTRRSIPLGVTILIFGLIGWYAAYALAVDKVLVSRDPSTELNCNVSLLVQCGTNLESWQGSVLGFPNPLVGLVSWAAIVTVGCLVLVGVNLARWFWITFNVAVLGALAFVVWFISQSVFVLGTLCPWCMVTWAVTIPLFWAVTLHNAAEGRFGAATQRILGPAYSWVPAITVASYIVVAVLAQARLDILSYL